MLTLEDVVSSVFRAYDFKLRPLEGVKNAWKAHRGSVTLFVTVTRATGDVADVERAIEIGRREDADRIIMVTTSGFTPEARRLEGGQVSLWGVERFRSEIGRAVLHRLEGGSAIDGSGLFDPFFSQESDLIERKEVIEGGEVEVESGLIVVHHLTEEDARRMVEGSIKGYRFDLQLMPYYVFDYEVEVFLGAGQDTERMNGRVAINGLTGGFEEWSKEVETVDRIPGDHRALNPRFGEDQAETLAREAVIALSTRSMDIQKDSESSLVIEHIKVRPKEDAVSLTRRGVYFVPLWCIEGSQGVIIIDATTGKVLRKELRSGADWGDAD